VAVHTVTCLEAHLHHDTALSQWSTFQDSDAPDPRDVLDLMRMHALFASSCASKCVLAGDLHLASVVSNLLDVFLRAATATEDRLLLGLLARSGVAWRRGEAKTRLVERLTDEHLWLRLEGLSKDMQQRVPYLKARLEYRAGCSTYEAWHVMMSFAAS
jgi:hypothetical protein